ncbi:THUMP-like domain-containing protein [Mycobacterium kyogaense]|uniref:THUMP-like domain-containing protein n=1 Tax=Mycobacterium kyogaense TaxID=2212479 RepID=UPI003FA54CE7
MVLQRHDHGGQAGRRIVVAFGLDDVRFLRTESGRQALAEVDLLDLTAATLVADVASARRQFGERAAVLVETVRLRRRAAAKFDGAAQWLFTDEALQQATAAPVAAHRARRLAGAVVHDATCSIGSELVALADSAASVMGSDLDPVRLAMARHNVGAQVPLCRADVLHPVSRDTVILADPARRTGSARRFDPRAYQPPLDDLLTTLAPRDYAVKCAPGIDFDVVEEMGFAGEIEVTSLAASVREACLWSPGLTSGRVRRRATILDTGEQVVDTDPDDCGVAPAGRWLVDPDGAVVRAGLVRHYAARHGLWQIDPDIAYLSGDELPDGVRGFEVLDQLAYSERHLRQALSARAVGAVEFLIRGVDVDPDALRKRMRLRGAERASVVITRLGSGAASRATAFICRPSR